MPLVEQHHPNISNKLLRIHKSDHGSRIMYYIVYKKPNFPYRVSHIFFYRRIHLLKNNNEIIKNSNCHTIIILENITKIPWKYIISHIHPYHIITSIKVYQFMSVICIISYNMYHIIQYIHHII